MGTLDIVLGSVILLISLLIVILGLMQGKETPNMTGAVTGGANESHFSKNEGRTKEAMLSKVTALLLVLLFLTTLTLTIIKART